MSKTPPRVDIGWRCENYGSVAAVAAFRNEAGSEAWTQRTHQRFRGCVRRAGFYFHEGRCSYLAPSGTEAARQLKLCEELASAGFHIGRGDVRPSAEAA